jgi:hypothetical protein
MTPFFQPRQDPQATSKSPPGGINTQINVSVTGQDIIIGTLLMMYIVYDAASQALHVIDNIFTSQLLFYLIINHFLLWFLIT